MKNKFNLLSLPYLYKKIGTLLILMSFMVPTFLGVSSSDDLYHKVILTFMMVGVLLTVISKSKNEDEMSERIRIVSIAYGFVFLILGAVITNWFFEDVFTSLLILVCVIPAYIINLILQKVNNENQSQGNIKLTIGIIALISVILISWYFNSKI